MESRERGVQAGKMVTKCSVTVWTRGVAIRPKKWSPARFKKADQFDIPNDETALICHSNWLPKITGRLGD